MGAASASPGAPSRAGTTPTRPAASRPWRRARARDRGGCKAIPKDIAQQILALRREQPRRSVRILIRAVERAKLVKDGELAPSTVSRLLRAHGLSQRPRVLPERERRAFTVPLPGDLWVGDAMHGPPVIGRDGALHTKTYLLSQIDVASRYLIHSEFFLQEDAGHQEDGLRRAIVSHGLPRDYYVDRGPAYIAESLRTICAELGIRLLHAGPGDAAAKGVIERFHRTWRAEVGSELPQGPLTLADLNERHTAWVTCEYHRRVHGMTHKEPLEDFLAGAHNHRPVPRDINMDDIFLHREARKVRNDGTVRWDGGFYEVPGEYVGQWVDLRYAPQEPERPAAALRRRRADLRGPAARSPRQPQAQATRAAAARASAASLAQGPARLHHRGVPRPPPRLRRRPRGRGRGGQCGHGRAR
jgi:putative transposase